MNAQERQDNEDQYLKEIERAIQHLVERCGGSLETEADSLPRELVWEQRDLFIHSGITGILSVAVKEGDRGLLDFFDWFLGYLIHKDRMDDESRDRFITTMLTSFHDQILKGCDPHEGPRFVNFLILFKFALMVLGGSLDREEFRELRECCAPLMERCLERQAETRRRDAEKN
jgi:hypothetical protein